MSTDRHRNSPSKDLDKEPLSKEDRGEQGEKPRDEDALRRAQKFESIGRLAGGVAHNLNNILSPVIGYTDMALELGESPESLREQLAEIRVATERAISLVRQLLAFGRKQSFELVKLNLAEVVTDLEIILRQTAGEHIELKLDLDTDVDFVMADLAQVQQIIINLVLNACEAISKSGTITIATANVALDQTFCEKFQELQPGPHVMLTVSDTGRGMDEETLRLVFEPFFTTKEIGEGTGLGLATVYGVIKQHGGFISADSMPDQGSAFRVYLPAYSEEEASVEAHSAKQSPEADEQTILVVEDEESLLKFTSLVLRKLGYKVIEASTGAEALGVAGSHDGPIDLLLTDVIMPGMNGKELYERIAASSPNTKVLYTSGYPDDVIAKHGILDRSENLLQKPTTMERLTQKVKSVLGR
jgi:two-component system cell cycle sensor histidine kinase/response regulator CckA